jgi:hypothetical protein
VLARLCAIISELTGSEWIAVFTAAITFGGLVVVVCQLRSLNRQTRLQNFAEYTMRYQQIVLNFPEDINSKDFLLKGREDYDKVMRYMRAYFDLCFEEWYLHQRQLIEGDFWTIWFEGMRTALAKPAFQQAWQVMKADTNFGPEFSKFAEDRMLLNSDRS